MRNVSIAELEKHLPELEAGERLTLVHGGKAVAEVVPLAVADDALSAEQRAAASRLLHIMEEGVDLEGAHIEDRDSLYDRHSLHR